MGVNKPANLRCQWVLTPTWGRRIVGAMTGRRSPMPFPIVRTVFFAILGGLAALLVGLAAVALAPDEGMVDLAFASLTKIFFVPLGIVVGATIGWRTARR